MIVWRFIEHYPPPNGGANLESTMFSDFERIVGDSMIDTDGLEWNVSDVDGWDPIMGDDAEWLDTDDEWLDDFQGEEDFA